VAHDEKELDKAPTFWELYLQPIIHLFDANHGRISPDTAYAPVLMIDIKKSSRAVLAKLVEQLSAYPVVFDREINPHAVQIVISGDRPPRKNTEENKDGELSWTLYPRYIFFDGRPNETYDKATLQRWHLSAIPGLIM
jgi:alkaline phosphatase